MKKPIQTFQTQKYLFKPKVPMLIRSVNWSLFLLDISSLDQFILLHEKFLQFDWLTVLKYHSWYLMPNITTNHAITYTNVEQTSY